MSIQKCNINFDKFYTEDGMHTCSLGEGQDCSFLLTGRFGLEWICGVNQKVLSRRGEDGLGYLIPDKDCMLCKNYD